MNRDISYPGWMNSALIKTHWRNALYLLALTAVLLAVMFTFIHEKTAKVAFYWAFYFSLLGIITHLRPVNRRHFWLAGWLALLGCSKVVWFYWDYLGQPHFDPYNDYLNAGKRLLIAAVIGYYLFSQQERLPQLTRRMVEWGLIVAFVGATVYGFYQYTNGARRVEFALDRATLSAYGYAMLAAATLFMLAAKRHSASQLLLCLGVFVIAWFIIIQTGTRNMIAAFPLIIFFVGLLRFRHLGWKAALGILTAIVLLIAACYKPMIKPRIDASMAELTRYEQAEGNKSGSLTSRLAMWNIGAACFAANPLGMNMEQRTAWFKHYVKENHRDASALEFVSIHLHNELLDSATLQGIPGMVIVLAFYLTLILRALRKNNALLLSVMLVTVVSGLTDVLFISREITICISLLLILCVMWKSPVAASSPQP